MSSTTCSRCSSLFEASEEYGNAPGRLCASCWQAGYRADAVGNLYRVCISCGEARPVGRSETNCHVCGKPGTWFCPEDGGPAGSCGRVLCDTCRCSCGGHPKVAPHVLDLTVRQAVIDWNRAHVEPGRPFPPLNIDKNEEGSLADAVLIAIRRTEGGAK